MLRDSGQRFEKRCASLEKFHSPNEEQVPSAPTCLVISARGRFYRFSRRLLRLRLGDFIHEAVDARFGYSIPDVFFPHVSGVCDDCLILVKVCQSAGFAAKQPPHGDRVPAPAAPRKIVQETCRAKFPGAWSHGGKFESLHAAYTGSIVVM